MSGQPRLFKKHFLLPLILLFTIPAYFLWWLWSSGLMYDSIGRGISWVVCAGLYALVFLVLGIIVVVRLFLKRKNRVLVTIITAQFIFSPMLAPRLFREIAFRLNLALYQHDREEIVKMIQHGELNPAGISMNDIERNESYPVLLPDKFAHAVNKQVYENGKPLPKSVAITRNCEGELSVIFPIEDGFLGEERAILYSDSRLEMNSYRSKDPTTFFTVDKNSVERPISYRWNYVKVSGTGLNFHFDLNLFGGGGGGSSGSSLGGNAGGCQ